MPTRAEYQKRATPCCGRKPLIYLKNEPPSYPRGQFCSRCCRSYDLDDEIQVENWAWKIIGGKWAATGSDRVAPERCASPGRARKDTT